MNAREISILYRGPLSSCNYDCSYCPFAKRHETAAELDIDRRALERFVNWVCRSDQLLLNVFFTPWGEAMTRSWYRQAMVQLSRQPQVQKIVAQTNLSFRQDWLPETDVTRLAFWCTYHPSEISRDEFLNRSRQLTATGVAHSVGMVGRPQDLDEIEAVRRELPSDIYLWINAWEVSAGKKYAYSEQEIHRLESVDPWFRFNHSDHSSAGKICRTGTEVFSVNGDGQVRRCHFVETVMGNLYEPGFCFPSTALPCPNATCTCHIGYVHLQDLQLQQVFGTGILERIPVREVFRSRSSHTEFLSRPN
ncbi:MAG: STM4011 family radical SAM protein [Planctomycetaceae bacterium]